MKWTRPKPPFPAAPAQARAAFLRGDFASALAMYVDGPASNDPAALVFAGWMITEGLGSPRYQQSDGRELYLRAAAGAHHDAYFWLGDYYERIRDYKTSKEHYIKAAGLGNVPAHFRLGLMATRTDPAIMSADESIRWLALAAEKGHAQADARLAHLAFRGSVPGGPLRGLWLLARSILRATRYIIFAPTEQRPGIAESHPCLRL